MKIKGKSESFIIYMVNIEKQEYFFFLIFEFISFVCSFLDTINCMIKIK